VEDFCDRVVDGFIIISYITVIVLRLCNVIHWSWWLILAPFWIPVGLGILYLVLSLILLFINIIYERIKKKNERN